jgi:hypothetical protein
VFTARYALSPYIKQIRFVFKGIIMSLKRRGCRCLFQRPVPEFASRDRKTMEYIRIVLSAVVTDVFSAALMPLQTNTVS